MRSAWAQGAEVCLAENWAIMEEFTGSAFATWPAAAHVFFFEVPSFSVIGLRWGYFTKQVLLYMFSCHTGCNKNLELSALFLSLLLSLLLVLVLVQVLLLFALSYLPWKMRKVIWNVQGRQQKYQDSSPSSFCHSSIPSCQNLPSNSFKSIIQASQI